MEPIVDEVTQVQAENVPMPADDKEKAQKAIIEQMLRERRTGNLLKLREDYKNGNVVLIFDGVEYPMPIFKARELALALRQAANKIERQE